MSGADELIMKGRREGLQEGRIAGRLEVAERLVKHQKHMDLALIADLTGLSLEKIKEIKKGK